MGFLSDAVGFITDNVPVVGDIVGGILGHDSASDANKTNLKISREQTALQKEFAQKGIQWKTQDAKKAGIHPLAALGANTMSYQPTSLFTQPDNSMADAVRSVSQKIGTNIQNRQIQNAQKELKNITLDMARAELRGTQLENELLSTQINNLRTAQPNSKDDISYDPKGPTDAVIVEPSRRPASESRDSAHMTAAVQPKYVPHYSTTGVQMFYGEQTGDQISESMLDKAKGYYERFAEPYLTTLSLQATKKMITQRWPKATGMVWKNFEWQPYYGTDRNPNRFRVMWWEKDSSVLRKISSSVSKGVRAVRNRWQIDKANYQKWLNNQ